MYFYFNTILLKTRQKNISWHIYIQTGIVFIVNIYDLNFYGSEGTSCHFLNYFECNICIDEKN